MAKYRKNPVSVDAFRFGYDLIPSEMAGDDRIRIHFDPDFHMIIHTLEGDMRANFGDYIIKGVQGELYPCKPDIFEATYSSDEIVAADAGDRNMTESDPVKSPWHYAKDDVECKQAQAAMIRDSYPNHCTATALKYLWRWQDKGWIEDLKKAAEYLQFAVDYVEDPYAFIHGHPKCNENSEINTPPVEDSHKPDTCYMGKGRGEMAIQSQMDNMFGLWRRNA